MSTRTTKVSIKVLAIGAVSAMAFVGAPTAFAADEEVTQTVIPGSLVADTTVADALDPVASSHSATPISAALNLHVDDTTGSAAGWHVTQKISDFSNVATGTTIPASNFSITGIGDAIDTKDGSVDASLTSVGGYGSLSGAGRIVLEAAASEGVGEYNAPIAVELLIPADTRAGTYTATLTTTVTAGTF